MVCRVSPRPAIAGPLAHKAHSAHSDYQIARPHPARRRYLGRLYAKELVPSAVLERLLEVLTRLDEHL